MPPAFRFMPTDEERCVEARVFERIDAAFRDGNLDALRQAVEDPAVVPNGRMPDTIGSCLVYAIYHSPLAFIRTLLEIGADPNAPVDDGFPPLIGALCKVREVPGSTRRTDGDSDPRPFSSLRGLYPRAGRELFLLLTPMISVHVPPTAGWAR